MFALVLKDSDNDGDEDLLWSEIWDPFMDLLKKKKTAVRVKSLYNTDFLTQKKITSFCSMFHIVFCFA